MVCFFDSVLQRTVEQLRSANSRKPGHEPFHARIVVERHGDPQPAFVDLPMSKPSSSAVADAQCVPSHAASAFYYPQVDARDYPRLAKLPWHVFKTWDEGKFATVMLAKHGNMIAVLKMFKTTQMQNPDGELAVWLHLQGVEGVEPLIGVLAVDQEGYHKKGALMFCHVRAAVSVLYANR